MWNERDYQLSFPFGINYFFGCNTFPSMSLELASVLPLKSVFPGLIIPLGLYVSPGVDHLILTSLKCSPCYILHPPLIYVCVCIYPPQTCLCLECPWRQPSRGVCWAQTALNCPQCSGSASLTSRRAVSQHEACVCACMHMCVCACMHMCVCACSSAHTGGFV